MAPEELTADEIQAEIAEGRGFESHHPLLNKAPEIGAFVFSRRAPENGAIWAMADESTRTASGPEGRELANSRGRETALSTMTQLD